MNAPVAIGSLYITRYFTSKDKVIADDILSSVFEAYLNVLKNISWVKEEDKQQVIHYTEKMQNERAFIGYHVNLETEGPDFYKTLKEYPEEEFYNNAMSIKIFNAIRKSKLLGFDWTKYSQPHTVNAFYNSKDGSIQFPAGILQVN